MNTLSLIAPFAQVLYQFDDAPSGTVVIADPAGAARSILEVGTELVFKLETSGGQVGFSSAPAPLRFREVETASSTYEWLAEDYTHLLTFSVDFGYAITVTDTIRATSRNLGVKPRSRRVTFS